MPKETKFTLAIMLVICGCFGVVVWQKMEHQKKLLAAMNDQPGHHGHQHGPGASSPFEQYPGGLTPSKPPRQEEPRRLPPDRGPAADPLNPFNQPPQQVGVGKPEPPGRGVAVNPPPKDLFQPPTQKPGPGPSPFETSKIDPTPTVSKPAPPAGASPFDEKLKPLPPAQPEKVAVTPPQNPFDGGFPAAQPTGPPPAKTAQGPTGQAGFPMAGQPPAQPTAGPPPANPFDPKPANPFDKAVPPGGPPQQTTQVTPAVDNKPPGGFNPFTPVQHSEPKGNPAPPAQNESGFNPFDTMSLPETNPKPPQPPAQPEPKPNSSVPSVPSPFDGFPLQNAPTKPAEPPRPKPQPPQPTRPQPPEPPKPPQTGFPSDGGFTPPVHIDPQEPVRVYTVEADETYWSISKKLYGTTRYFQALAEHNRHRVGDPTRLRPGMKILVPDDKILERLYGRILPGGPSRGEGREGMPEGLFYSRNGEPLYRVSKEDSLSSIAQKHLGRSSRWVEIYQLNGETLKGPDKLKLGMILKMPADASRIVYDSEPRVIK